LRNSRLSRSRFSLPVHSHRLSELDHKLAAHDLWTDPDQAQRLIQEHKSVRKIVEPFLTLQADLKERLELVALADPGTDQEVLSEIERDLVALKDRFTVLDHQAMFRHPDDHRGAILTIQAGAGGVDAMDWALQLERMYERYLDREGFVTARTDRLEGGTAGIHHVELQVQGPYAYGKLKSERGVHRIQHVSAFDSNGKKQTSFAAVDVVPIHHEITMDIQEKDLEFETMRSGGPGGQGVQTTDSAVRVRHLPTGLIVRCQVHRSQHANKQTAIEILASRLLQREEDKKEKRERLEASFGHQIRTYVIEPYQMVKDHRSGFETSGVAKILAGDLGGLIEAYLRTQ
jgi:peptide chain release factor 2